MTTSRAAVLTGSAAFVVVGATAMTVAAVIGVAAPVLGGPVWGSTAVTATLSVLLVALVLGGRRSRPDLAAAATAAVGAVSVGLAVTDLQLFTRALDADRLDLFRPTTTASPVAGLGAVVLTAGHLALVVAGVLAVLALARPTFLDDPALDDTETYDPAASDPADPDRRPVLIAVGAVAAASSVALPAYVSTDSVFLAPSVLGAPLPLALGYVLAALATLVVVAVAATSTRGDVLRGALVGIVLAVLLVVAPRLPAAAAAGDRIDVGPGTWAGLAGAAALLVAARPASAPRDDRSDRRAPRPSRTRGPVPHVTAGLALLASAIVAGVGSLLPVLAADGPVPSPGGTAAVAVSSMVVAVVGVLLLLSEFAPSVRPAAPPILAAHVAVVAVVLQAVVLGVGVDGVRPGLGGWLLVVAVLVAVAAGIALAAAGATDRGAAEGTATGPRDEPERPRPVHLLAWATAASIVVGSLLPARTVAGRVGGWVGTWPWGWDVWGRVVFAAVVVATTAILLRARRSRAVAAAVGTAIAAGGTAAAALLEGGTIGGAITGVGAIGAALLAGLLTRTDQ